MQVGGKNIAELVTMPVSEAKAFFDQLELDETDAAIAKRCSRKSIIACNSCWMWGWVIWL